MSICPQFIFAIAFQTVPFILGRALTLLSLLSLAIGVPFQ